MPKCHQSWLYRRGRERMHMLLTQEIRNVFAYQHLIQYFSKCIKSFIGRELRLGRKQAASRRNKDKSRITLNIP